METSAPFRHTALYISHGAGPMPILGDPGHTQMLENLALLKDRMPKPSAIIVVSAHWEEAQPTVTGAANPGLLYDYYGFPQESYEIDYPAPGYPVLAAAVHNQLESKGIACRTNTEREFDHGMFIPLKLMYPEADIPCIQLSLIKGLAPAAHIAMGKALAGIEHDNLLILGSGFSFHNMHAFFTPDTPETRAQNEAFERWLIETCSSPSLDDAERTERLRNWTQAPAARYCHPREEHLLPLLVCAAAAGTPCREYFELEIIGKKASTYLW